MRLEIRALTFDIFGTVVDWRTSTFRRGQLLGQCLGPAADWAEWADGWRAGYQPAMQGVRAGALPWTNIDRLLAVRGIHLAGADAAAFNRVWQRQIPWPDSVAGLYRLKARYMPGCSGTLR